MISSGQVSVSGTVPLVTVPPGVWSLALATTAGTAYAGTGGSVSTSTGFPVTSSAPVTLSGFTGSRGGTVYATVSSGMVNTAWMLSTLS